MILKGLFGKHKETPAPSPTPAPVTPEPTPVAASMPIAIESRACSCADMQTILSCKAEEGERPVWIFRNLPREAFQRAMTMIGAAQLTRKVIAINLNGAMDLQTLSDEQLAGIGLKRIEDKPTVEVATVKAQAPVPTGQNAVHTALPSEPETK